ncbi:hypothetical protein GA417_05590 [Poseidonibacter ostreae]|uniref:hypothetical protein n=1 Tax=Poseidonibacter ostreae TaxID=2654171 RepID=UPI0012643766|nr:hypothetical protein [Poseidonibacter ostreae]KAB7886422.1 hypothetical protein GA417_05590 [Poseidonibacter ostreae]
MLDVLRQKNENTIYYSANKSILFKIREYKLPDSIRYLSIDYTYKLSKISIFSSFKEAEEKVLTRFSEYQNKYSKNTINGE